MALEREWDDIPSINFLQDGGEDGLIVLSDTANFRVKQKVKIKSLSEPDLVLQVKKVSSPTRLYVGPIDNNMNTRANLSSYTVANIASISAERQQKVTVPKDDQYKTTYEQEPVLARRTIAVDQYGDFYTQENRLPVDVGDTVDITIENVTVDLEGFSSDPDSVMITGSINGSPTGTKYGFVNNLRQQVLATHDREQQIIYADFGTKNQRITEIIYTSATFPSVTVKKVIDYTLVGNKYRRDSINWEIL
jgi:hypothetical protein